MKIRTAIFGSYVVASAIGFTVLMGFMLREVRPRYVESMADTLRETAALLAGLVGDEVADGRAPGAAWAEKLNGLASEPGGLRVYVTDRQGRVTFDSAGGRDLGLDYSRRPELGADASSEYGNPQQAGIVDDELRVAAPVIREGVLVGHVGVARPLHAVTAAILRARLRLAAGGLAVAAAMLLIGWAISQRLTHALERLTAYVGDVRDGRQARRPTSRAAEVEALARAFDEMRTALEGKAYVEEYTQTLTHELKAISAIRGAAELLDEDMPEDERARFLANLRHEAARLQNIVDRMLQLSALEARRTLKEVGRVELFALVDETVAAFRTQAQARRIELRVKAVHALVHGERFLLGQALSNLLQNAIEFSAPGGVVEIRIRNEAGQVRVEIDDDGPGVPEYARTRIFERFYSLPRPDTGRKSTGLGLSFVREIAHLHGGEVAVGNRPQGGARAVLTLPAA
jgi:two-component system sensor histidine kinase CreC